MRLAKMLLGRDLLRKRRQAVDHSGAAVGGEFAVSLFLDSIMQDGSIFADTGAPSEFEKRCEAWILQPKGR